MQRRPAPAIHLWARGRRRAESGAWLPGHSSSRWMDEASLFLRLEWRRERGKATKETRPGTHRAARRPGRGTPRLSAHLFPRSYPRRGVSRRALPWRPHRTGQSALGPRSSAGVAARLTASSCQSCAGCSVRAACARTAWLRLPQHRPGRGTELDAATLAAVHPKAALEPEWAEAGAFYRPSGGRGGRGRGSCRPAPTAGTAGGRR